MIVGRRRHKQVPILKTGIEIMEDNSYFLSSTYKINHSFLPDKLILVLIAGCFVRSRLVVRIFTRHIVHVERHRSYRLQFSLKNYK